MLEGESFELASQASPSRKSAGRKGADPVVQQACRDLGLYRNALMQILDVHMALAKRHKKIKRKKAPGSSKHKRKLVHK